MDMARAANRACHDGWPHAARLFGTAHRRPRLHHGVFSWDGLLISDVLPALRTGRALQYRPPAWISRRREGAISVENNRNFVIIEGVGSSQESVRPELDVIIWVETPQSVRESRDAARVAAGEISASSYANWMAEENAYMAAERPWEHADLIVDGGGSLAHDQEIVVALNVPPLT